MRAAGWHFHQERASRVLKLSICELSPLIIYQDHSCCYTTDLFLMPLLIFISLHLLSPNLKEDTTNLTALDRTSPFLRLLYLYGSRCLLWHLESTIGESRLGMYCTASYNTRLRVALSWGYSLRASVLVPCNTAVTYMHYQADVLRECIGLPSEVNAHLVELLPSPTGVRL